MVTAQNYCSQQIKTTTYCFYVSFFVGIKQSSQVHNENTHLLKKRHPIINNAVISSVNDICGKVFMSQVSC